ncbi:hypothetical protein CC80DRAFT_552150 [Byssothecium circinans]|uniref:Uncharacterized protein n=1 Tax=Byssothecium circinans TaxID=147558 RepID=A0A6A5TIK3_9PLEO|nr:hypothetical protein CC80DRAFT_552150 [Byssothecium circinans]
METAFDAFLKDKLPPLWSDSITKEKLLEQLTSTAEDWGVGVLWNTYNKVLREHGIVPRTQAKKYVPPDKRYGSINWNEELSVTIHPDMASWERRMNALATTFARDLDNTTFNTCAAILSSISTSSLAPELKNIALEEWGKRQERIIHQSQRCDTMLRAAIKLTHQFATTETDTRCMVAKVNSKTYDAVEGMPRVVGWYVNQRAMMVQSMKQLDDKNRDILDRIAAAVRKDVKKNLRAAFAAFVADLIKEVDMFDEHIGERVPAAYDLLAGDVGLRAQLKGVLPRLEERVRRLQVFFEGGRMVMDGSVSAAGNDKGRSRAEEGVSSEPAANLGTGSGEKVVGVKDDEVDGERPAKRFKVEVEAEDEAVDHQ